LRTAGISRAFTKSGALVAGSCVKYREISDKMVTDIAATGAEAVLAGDLGCLLNMAGKLYRQARQVEVRHVAEVLSDMADRVPAMGAPR
jgi:L-lactate dehydrogenase complex protein LldE